MEKRLPFGKWHLLSWTLLLAIFQMPAQAQTEWPYCAHTYFRQADLEPQFNARVDPVPTQISFVENVAVVLEYPSLWDVHNPPDPDNYPNMRAQPGYFNNTAILNTLSTVVDPGCYDFVLLLSLQEVPGWIHSGGRYFNAAKNIGLYNPSYGQQWAPAGWSRLRGIPHMNDVDFLSRTSSNLSNYGSTMTAFHEMFHFWGVFYTGSMSPGPRDWIPGSPVAWLAQASSHWTWVWDDLPDFEMPGIMYSGPTDDRFNAIDLYTMGLMNYTEAATHAYSVYDFNNPMDHYPVNLDTMIYGLSLRGANYYEGDGKRIPATDPTAEDLNILLVVIKGQDETITQTDHDLIVALANDYPADWATATWGRSAARCLVQRPASNQDIVLSGPVITPGYYASRQNIYASGSLNNDSAIFLAGGTTYLQPGFRVLPGVDFYAGPFVDACPPAPASRTPGDQPPVAFSSGPEQSPALTVELMPNPVRDLVQISFSNPARQDVRLRILDARGTEVWQKTLTKLPAGPYLEAISADHWPAGIYYLQVRSDLGSTSRKMILAR